MDNYKIKVNDEASADEARDLFKSLVTILITLHMNHMWNGLQFLKMVAEVSTATI